MLKQVTPLLYTEHLDQTIVFYTTILGFERIGYDEEAGWTLLRRDSIDIMFNLPSDVMPFERPLMTGSIYFGTDTVDEMWETLKDKVEVCYPIEDFYYGMREFGIFDNNHYLIQFGQDIST